MKIPEFVWIIIIVAVSLLLCFVALSAHNEKYNRYKEGYENGYTDGYDEGYEMGYKDGFGEGFDVGSVGDN